MIELTFMMVLILIRQLNQKNAIFGSYSYFLDKRFKFQPDICNSCCDVLMMSMNLSNIAFLNIHHAGYHCIISEIIKSETINLLQNIILPEKNRT